MLGVRMTSVVHFDSFLELLSKYLSLLFLASCGVIVRTSEGLDNLIMLLQFSQLLHFTFCLAKNPCRDFLWFGRYVLVH